MSSRSLAFLCSESIMFRGMSVCYLCIVFFVQNRSVSPLSLRFCVFCTKMFFVSSFLVFLCSQSIIFMGMSVCCVCVVFSVQNCSVSLLYLRFSVLCKKLFSVSSVLVFLCSQGNQKHGYVCLLCVFVYFVSLCKNFAYIPCLCVFVS